MTWQTNMDVFSPYPQRCKSFQEMNDHTPNALGDQTAFYCARFPYHRIIEDECLGDECPDCKLVGFDEYMKEMES